MTQTELDQLRSLENTNRECVARIVKTEAERDRLRESNAELLAACEAAAPVLAEAANLIRFWHGPVAIAEYETSPEMTRIRGAIDRLNAVIAKHERTNHDD